MKQSNIKDSELSIYRSDMKQLEPKIREIAERIKKTENSRKKLASFVRDAGNAISIIRPVERSLPENIKVVGIDGGITKRSLHGFDCVITRSVAVCFEYENNAVKNVSYYPPLNPAMDMDVTEALSDIDWAYYTSIMRMSSEIETAIGSIEHFSPDIIMLDGSIVPHQSDAPSKSSEVYVHYHSLVGKYAELYRRCQEKGIMLIGVVEDSRSKRFAGIIGNELLSMVSGHRSIPEAKALLERSRDTSLLYWVLKKGERTIAFPYSSKVEEHPFLKQMDESVRNSMFSFYIKTAEMDRPFRVDYMSRGEGQEDAISSILLSISGHHSGYGIPVPIIEADNVAKLSEQEMDNMYSRILSITGNLPGVMSLRRDQRPF